MSIGVSRSLLSDLVAEWSWVRDNSASLPEPDGDGPEQDDARRLTELLTTVLKAHAAIDDQLEAIDAISLELGQALDDRVGEIDQLTDDIIKVVSRFELVIRRLRERMPGIVSREPLDVDGPD